MHTIKMRVSNMMTRLWLALVASAAGAGSRWTMGVVVHALVVPYAPPQPSRPRRSAQLLRYRTGQDTYPANATSSLSTLVDGYSIRTKTTKTSGPTCAATTLSPLDFAPTTLSKNKQQLKEELFVQWMTTDSLVEIPHPGIELTVQGRIPWYVHGFYIKNGPGALSTPDQSQRYTHAFDGLAKLQKYDIRGGRYGNSHSYKHQPPKVVFTARFVDSPRKRNMLERNTISAHIALGPVEPRLPQWQVVINTILDAVLNTALYDNASANIEEVASGVYCAVTDSSIRQEIDIATLNTKGRLHQEPIVGMYGAAQFSTAHGRMHPTTNRRWSYNFYVETTAHGLGYHWAHVVRTDCTDGTRTSIGKVKVNEKFSYVHDISITEHYAIVVFCPLLIDLTKALNEASLLQALEYHESQSTQICVFDLHADQSHSGGGGGPVATFEAPPFWCFHHVNAFEEKQGTSSSKAGGSSRIVLDVLAHEAPNLDNGYLDQMTTEQARVGQKGEGTLWRFNLDVKHGKDKDNDEANGSVLYVEPKIKTVVDRQTGRPWSMELASVAPDRVGRPYRYAYGFTAFHKGVPLPPTSGNGKESLGSSSSMLDWAILKQDVAYHERHAVWYEEFMYPGEVSFVKNPAGIKEDDGVLLSTVYDSRRRENCLLVLDAQTMKELARAYTGVAFPPSFHGKFFPQ